MPHQLVVHLVVRVEPADERERPAVRDRTVENVGAGADQIVERSAADVAVCCRDRLARMAFLAESGRRNGDQPVVLIGVILVEIDLAWPAAVLGLGVGCPEPELRPGVRADDQLLCPSEMLPHLGLVRVQDVPHVREALFCLILRRREDIDVILRHAVDLGEQAEVLKAQISVLTAAPADVDQQDREAERPICAVHAVVQREAEDLPREKPECKVLLVPEVCAELICIDPKILGCEDPFDQVAQLQLFAAHRVLTAAHDSDVVGDLLTDRRHQVLLPCRCSARAVSGSRASTWMCPAAP